jgi:hypothetical protein
MISKLLLAALLAAAPMHAYTQGQDNESGGAETKRAIPDPADAAIEKHADETLNTDKDKQPANPQPPSADASIAKKPIDYGYVRPDAKQRFRNYLNNLAGPVSLGYYASTAGLLTLRNSPKEWGDRSDGFGRRFANVAAKNGIMSTAVYGLDEALKIDSAFYRSKDRSLAARLRNSVFSAVTARNKKGKRVIGLPVIAGGILSEVASSSGWYPKRFDYVHGLKGGAISIGITTGMNLFKEIVWKR